MDFLVVVIALLLLFSLTVPVAVSLFFAGLIGFVFYTDIPLKIIGQIMVIKLDSYPLLAVLFFILAGNIIVYGKISEHLINFVVSVVGTIRGGLAIAGVVACALFGAISGSALATYAAIGGIMVPVLREKGYGERFSVGIMAASSVLGIIIPPSIPMVLYCVVADQSVGRLFLAGFLPGIFITTAVSIWINYWAKKNKIRKLSERFELKNVAVNFRKSIWAFLLPLLIYAGIFSGAITVTEAAVIGTVYCIIIELFINRFLKIDRLPKIFFDSALTTATLLIAMAGAMVFSEYLTLKQVPEMLLNFFSAYVSSPFLTLLVIIGILLIAGCFIDAISNILIFTPIIVPLASRYNIDLIHLGLITVVSLGIGYITPPVGGNIYLAVALHKAKFGDVVAGIFPSLVIWTIVLVVLALVPQVSTFLPNLVMGKIGG